MNNSRIQILEQYIKEEPQDPFNWYALANEYITDNPQKAIGYFEKLLQDHPEYLGTYYQAGKLYYAFNEIEKSKVIFELGIKLALKQNNAKTLNELRGALNEILDEDL